MSRLEPESVISHYKIKELIASGGMGEVYRAIDLQLGRVVALKTIHTLRNNDPNAHPRLLREARAASILSHPSICTIYEIGQEADLTFIAMQYVPGRTIQDRLLEGQLPIETVLGYALDVADALSEAHRNGVIHRDIKPSNIIANERDVAVVLDFGLAKQISFGAALNEEVETLANLTAPTTLLGTVPYMPPEQIRGETLDERSDIFSLGVTLYEMLSGKRPFDRSQKVDLLHAILHDEPQPINELRPDVDPTLAAIINKALEKNRSERFQSVGEFRQELINYIRQVGYLIRGVSSISATVSTGGMTLRPIAKPARRSLVLPAIGLLILLLVIAAVWLFLRNSNKADTNLAVSLRHVELVNWKSEPGESDMVSAMSRDGTMIAYSSIREGRSTIWIKQTAGGNPVQVTKDEWNSANPIWSPDDQQIAYVSKRGDQTGIWRMPAFGGTPRLITEVKGVTPKYWSKDGRTIYYESQPNLFKVDVASGQTLQITSLEQSSTDPNFSISQNEDRIAYIGDNADRFDVWVMSARGGSPTRVTDDSSDDRNPVWHPDGQRIIYSSLRNGTYEICVAYLDGRKPLQITSGENDKFVLSVSADGAKILYSSSGEEADIWSVNVDSREELQVTSDIGSEMWPDVSPDNQTMAFQAIRQPGQGRKINDCSILIKPIQSGGQTLQATTGRAPSWSPDGKRVAFERFSNNELNLRTINSTGGDERQITPGGMRHGGYTSLPYLRNQIRDYSWSPDSSRLAYCTSTLPGTNVCTIAADGSGKPTIISSSTSDNYSCPLWSPNGDQLAYLSTAAVRSSLGTLSQTIWVANNETGKSQPVFQTDSNLRLLGWAGKDLIAASSEGKTISTSAVNLIRVGAAGGGPQQFARLDSTYLYNVQLSPDGRFVAFASRQDGKDNIWLVPTRGGEARKLTSNSDSKLYFSSMAFSPNSKTIYYGRQSTFNVISEVDNFR